MAGHNRLQWVIKNDLYRPGRDRLFTVVREPTEIILSALNYTIGKLISDPYGKQPDTRGWLRSMGVTRCSRVGSARHGAPRAAIGPNTA